MFWFLTGSEKNQKPCQCVAAALAALLPAFPVRQVPPALRRNQRFHDGASGEWQEPWFWRAPADPAVPAQQTVRALREMPVIFEELPFVAGQMPVRVASGG